MDPARICPEGVRSVGGVAGYQDLATSREQVDQSLNGFHCLSPVPHEVELNHATDPYAHVNADMPKLYPDGNTVFHRHPPCHWRVVH